MFITKSIQPVNYPISVDELKLHLRVTGTTEDELIRTQLDSAVEYCEAYEGQSYMFRTYTMYLDYFPSGGVVLPYSPVVSVSSITYYDSAGSLQTLATSVYTVDKDSMPARTYLSYNQSWPTTYPIPKAVIITYIAGYATTFTAADTDILTLGNSVFAEGNIVRVQTDKGDLPSPLAAGTNYYVRTVSGSTIKLATTNSDLTIVNLTDAGTGTHWIGFAGRGLIPGRVKSAIKLICTDLYENRQQSIDTNLDIVPTSAQNMLMERLFA